MTLSEQEQSSQFDKLTIHIASDEVIKRDWSRGEIKKPETINYRTFKPEKGGLFFKIKIKDKLEFDSLMNKSDYEKFIKDNPN